MPSLENLIADSSFYICFLDCIEEPIKLMDILKNFQCHIPPKIHNEINKSKNYSKIDPKSLNIFTREINLGEALRPFISKKEIEKGEHEVIVLAFVFHNAKLKFLVVLDEKSKRNLIENFFPYLSEYLTGTIGIIERCYFNYRIFNKHEAILIIIILKKQTI